MLEVRHIDTRYGKTQALWDVCLEINKGEIVALVGANGAGKTTLLKTVSGLVHPTAGRVEFLGQQIDGLPAHAVAELGIAHIPEGAKVFPDMTVRENLEMGAYPHRAWTKRAETLEEVCEVFPILKERQGQLASTLSGGERQMLAIGRGLMSRPELCLFDEPSYGLAPLFVREIFEIIERLRDRGITVLLIEQNVRRALEIADRAYVLENGEICLEGPSSELLQSDFVRKAYLGI